MKNTINRAEKARAVLASRRLTDFIPYVFPSYKVRPHNLIVMRAMQLAMDKVISRLMIFMPPQYGKSEIVSRKSPAFHLGRYPDDQVVLASYSANLATSLSRDARDLLETEPYRRVFPQISLSSTRYARANWGVAGRRGGCVAVGVSGSLAGERMNLGILDDPVKDLSETTDNARDMIYDWYWSVFYNRLARGAPIILCMTRWHEDDLAGRLLRLQNKTNDYWYILRLPAISETEEETLAWCDFSGVDPSLLLTNSRIDQLLQYAPEDFPHVRLSRGQIPLSDYKVEDPIGRAPGEPLDPDKHGIEDLELRQRGNPRLFAALWQQTPKVGVGGIIDITQFEEITSEQVPREPPIASVIAADLAFSRKDVARSDFTAIVEAWLYPNPFGKNFIIVVNRIEFRRGPFEKIMRDLAGMMATTQFEGTTLVLETNGPQKALFEAISRSALFQGINMVGLTPVSDKVSRCQGWVSMLDGGNIKIITDTGSDLKEFYRQCEMFPNGRHDDGIDAMSLAWAALSKHMQLGGDIRVVDVEGLFA